MIRHLTQLNFQGFGTILPERRDSAGLKDKPGVHRELQLRGGSAPVWLANEDCWVCSGNGMTVLSVSTDGKEYAHFYLDKPVCIHAGIRFSLAPQKSDSTAILSAPELPEVVDHRKADDDFLLRPRATIEGIYTLFYHEKEQGFFFPGEAHPMLELTYVDQGTLHSVADGVDLVLRQGDMVLYAPNQWHMQYADIGVAPRFVTISFYISGQIPEELFGHKLKVSQTALGLLRQILQEQERPDSHSEDMILALLRQLLIMLQREENAAPTKLKATYSVHNENEIIRRAQQFISANVRRKLSVPLVARQVDVSPSYLTALFHKHLQIAPGEYIRRIKLQESKQMIRENTMNFTEIAAALHYSTVHHFSRQFKEKFGITPTEYAKSVR